MMTTRVRRKRELLTALIKKHGYNCKSTCMTKKEFLGALRSAFYANAEAYSEFNSYMSIGYYSVSLWDIEVCGAKSPVYGEVKAQAMDAVKNQLRKDWCFMVKWAVSADYFSSYPELVNYLFSNCENSYEDLESFTGWFLRMTNFVCSNYGFYI